MEHLVVDTDVASYYIKQDTRASKFIEKWSGKVLSVSFMTYAELLVWMKVSNWGPKRMEEFIKTLRQEFVFHPVDKKQCQLWASIKAEARANGFHIKTADAWIAAAAISLNAPLVTNNIRDFSRVAGLQLLDIK